MTNARKPFVTFGYKNYADREGVYEVYDPQLSFEATPQYLGNGEFGPKGEPEWVLHGYKVDSDSHLVRRTFKLSRILTRIMSGVHND